MIYIFQDLFVKKEIGSMVSMDSKGHIIRLGMVLLTYSNYKIRRTCMESYLIDKNLWEVVWGDARIAPITNEGNDETMQRWRICNAKADFVLKMIISHNLF